jgi:hypothetical protein
LVKIIFTIDSRNQESAQLPGERYDGTHPGRFVGHTQPSTYRRGDRVGQGKMIYDTGDIYDGVWSRDCMNGPGTFTKSTPEPKETHDIYSDQWQHKTVFDQIPKPE